MISPASHSSTEAARELLSVPAGGPGTGLPLQAAAGPW